MVSAESRLFSPFFGDVKECVRLISVTGCVVSGNAVLHSVERCPKWQGDEMVVIVQVDSFFSEKRRIWKRYLHSEGYFLVDRGMADSGWLIQVCSACMRACFLIYVRGLFLDTGRRAFLSLVFNRRQ